MINKTSRDDHRVHVDYSIKIMIYSVIIPCFLYVQYRDMYDNPEKDIPQTVGVTNLKMIPTGDAECKLCMGYIFQAMVTLINVLTI